ncbi:MAG: DUF1642 domain-containing protein [Lactococcus lactis]|jgi:hypothetical protein|nr:DUF1642 domain-containing protein [Lactococcus lactis]
MTKFEEEVKRPANGPLVELNNNMQEVFSQYRKMRQYADYLEYELNQKDEQLQEKATKLTFAEEEIHELGDKIGQLESQLQQQALPVVPECVAGFVSGDENELSKADRIAYLLKSVQGDSYYLTEELPGDGTITLDEGQELYNWAICQHHETILKLWNDFKVEKQPLFYLKHIDFCKTDKHYDWFTIKHSDGPLNHLRVEKGQKPSTIDCKFTQQEIDSMETGSYEQIEVTE